ncbi:MAG: hypothetical protein MJZ24_05485, partial [Paludibacteraceae bacterium]|nr:hypothetical protein [Paludibacteraceae bacterium]
LPTNFTGPVAALDWAKTKLKLEHYEKHRLVRRLPISHKTISVSTAQTVLFASELPLSLLAPFGG